MKYCLVKIDNERWDRIVELASEHNFTLPQQPDSKALDQFLLSAKAADALRYPDLCLSVIKLLGPREYVVELISGVEGMDVGHRLRVKLVHTDAERGFIDFKKV